MQDGTRVQIVQGSYSGYFGEIVGTQPNGWKVVRVEGSGAYRTIPVEWMEVA